MKPSSPGCFVALVTITILSVHLTPSVVVADEIVNEKTSRVAVVTGGNKGIGYAIVKGLCEQFDGIVYLTARDEERGRAAVENLKKVGLNPRFHQLDITDDLSVETLRNYISETHGGLDILVNNAGVFYKEDSPVPFAVQATESVRVNYFGVLRVSKALSPLLRPHARVVQISSALGHLSKIPGDALKAKLSSPDLTEDELSQLMREFVQCAQVGNHEAAGWPNDAYAVSKAGVAALTRVEQKEFDKDAREDLAVNAAHPGYTSTDLTDYQGEFTPERGAQTPLFLALLEPDNNLKGKYVWHDKTPIDWVNGTLPSAY